MTACMIIIWSMYVRLDMFYPCWLSHVEFGVVNWQLYATCQDNDLLFLLIVLHLFKWETILVNTQNHNELVQSFAMSGLNPLGVNIDYKVLFICGAKAKNKSLWQQEDRLSTVSIVNFIIYHWTLFFICTRKLNAVWTSTVCFSASCC